MPQTITELKQEVADALVEAGFAASAYVPEQIYPEQPIALVGFNDPYLTPAEKQVFGFLRATLRLKVTIIAPVSAANEESTVALDGLVDKALKALCVERDWTFETFEGPGLYEGSAFPACNINIKNETEVR